MAYFLSVGSVISFIITIMISDYSNAISITSTILNLKNNMIINTSEN